MILTRLFSCLAGLALCSMHVSAADLDKIDRTILKEPVYQSKAPKYCLLVFGPEAKTRVWVVLDDDVLYVDRNGNGDLTEKGERFVERNVADLGDIFEVGDILEPDSKIKHTDLRIRRLMGSEGMALMMSIMIEGKRKHIVKGGLWPFLILADKPQAAPIIHFNAPLTIIPDTHLELTRAQKGEENAELEIYVGTRGLGRGAVVSVGIDAIPQNIHPLAEIEFPNKKADGEPIRAKYLLTKRC